ncbi:hypothetical protein M0812_02052 [Anaeramoeba flamelloides]|uniref:Uncharacterized protein n=1 Tax=Anaeramoeba flamelloides TaxID=1746091 RepID=A0AAV7Z2U2_9EUKA|nr:hypothetical protein M0812_02052 [Anaeramoeba flamelloides]
MFRSRLNNLSKILKLKKSGINIMKAVDDCIERCCQFGKSKEKFTNNFLNLPSSLEHLIRNKNDDQREKNKKKKKKKLEKLNTFSSGVNLVLQPFTKTGHSCLCKKEGNEITHKAMKDPQAITK